MPTLARVFIKTALLYLAAGITLGGALLIDKAYPFSPALLELLPLHFQWLLLGWTLQLALGMVYWIMPRTDLVRKKSWLGWLSYALLNVALAAFTIAELLPALATAAAPRWLEGMAALCLAATPIAFTLHIWPRVRKLVLTGLTPKQG